MVWGLHPVRYMDRTYAGRILRSSAAPIRSAVADRDEALEGRASVAGMIHVKSGDAVPIDLRDRPRRGCAGPGIDQRFPRSTSDVTAHADANIRAPTALAAARTGHDGPRGPDPGACQPGWSAATVIRRKDVRDLLEDPIQEIAIRAVQPGSTLLVEKQQTGLAQNLQVL